MRLVGSLGPAFASSILIVQIHVKPAFPLTVIGGVLNHLS